MLYHKHKRRSQVLKQIRIRDTSLRNAGVNMRTTLPIGTPLIESANSFDLPDSFENIHVSVTCIQNIQEDDAGYLQPTSSPKFMNIKL